ncbi:MAG: ABC transporter transmembrane domain-containing protein, partial [Cyanobacteria bacterium J06627_8]
MSSFKDIVNYFRPYWAIAVFSIAASSVFEVIDLLVPYATGQILNVLSTGDVDPLSRSVVTMIASWVGWPIDQTTMLGILLGVIFAATVVRAPIQPWLGTWFHWDIPLRSRRDQSNRVIQKLLTLPLEFFDENNPGRIAGRVARGLSNHTWTYPDVAGQLLPKLFRVFGIFVIISFIEWRIAIAFLISFVFILGFTLNKLQRLVKREAVLDRYMENTESRTSEIITNIKTVKAFATEGKELKRQQERLQREFTVVDYSIHRGYVQLFTWQRTVIQSCVFGILALTLFATVRGQISLGHFITTLT